MKTRLLPLGLVVACAVSTMLAQSPPASSPPPPDIQKMLATPVWYLNYMVRLEANGSDGLNPGSHSLHRATSGRMMLGIRSSGPSLSVILNPTIMQITSGDQMRALVGNYANWVHGPPLEDRSLPPNQRKTEAEADAYFERVRRENLLAHQRYSYKYIGDADHTQESGSATVQHIGEPALEFDAVSRKYRFMWGALSFTDSAANANPWPVTGTKETGIGTIHYRRQDIQSGMYPKEAIGSITPPILGPGGFFLEGSLPGSGNISYSSVHAIQLGPGLAKGLRGTLSIQFTLSPKPPTIAKLFIEPRDAGEYRDFRPIPGQSEDDPGNAIKFNWEVVQEGVAVGNQTKVTKVTLRLAKVSRYPGVCMNWPEALEGPVDPNAPPPKSDLRFNASASGPPSDCKLEEEGLVLVVTGNSAEAGLGIAEVECLDGAAIGELVAEAELADSRVLIAQVRGQAALGKLLIPDRDEGVSEIAKSWRRANANGLSDNEDEELVPEGDMGQGSGDGLTVWEEYRGFFQGGRWIDNCLPSRKDLFINNTVGARATAGIGLFRKITGLIVHDKLLPSEHRPDRVINHRSRSDRHVVDQHCLILRAVPGGVGSAQMIAGKDFAGPPKNTEMVNVALGSRPDEVFDLAPGLQVTRNGDSRHIAHELGHAIGIYHHGDRDPWLGDSQFGVLWLWRTVNGVEEILEGSGAGPKISVLKEVGLVPATIEDVFLQRTPEKVARLGLHFGQHSGDEDCVMRYNVASYYEFVGRPNTRVAIMCPVPRPGGTLCSSPAGTFFNYPTHDPQSHFGGADTLRGDCIHQFVISDRHEIQYRGPTEQAARRGP